MSAVDTKDLRADALFRARGIRGDTLVYAAGQVAHRCPDCDASEDIRSRGCEHCDGIGWIGIDPKLPTICFPGTSGRVAVMATRDRAGFSLWNPEDAA